MIRQRERERRGGAPAGSWNTIIGTLSGTSTPSIYQSHSVVQDVVVQSIRTNTNREEENTPQVQDVCGAGIIVYLVPAAGSASAPTRDTTPQYSPQTQVYTVTRSSGTVATPSKDFHSASSEASNELLTTQPILSVVVYQYSALTQKNTKKSGPKLMTVPICILILIIIIIISIRTHEDCISMSIQS